MRLLELWRYPVKSMRGACRAGATLGADKHAAERGEEPEEDECRSHEQEEDEERGTAVSVVGVPVGHFRR